MKDDFQKYLDKQSKNPELKKEQKYSETIQAIRDTKQGIGLSNPYTDVNEMFDDIVNYLATSYRASCFTHYCIGRDVTQLNVLRNVHRRISLGYSIPTVYVLFMLLH